MASSTRTVLWLALFAAARGAAAGPAQPLSQDRPASDFHWESSAPLFGPALAVDQAVSLKDPSIVRAKGRRQVYVTVKTDHSTCLEYLSFADWKDAAAAPRTLINLTPRYHGAPQIFYYTPEHRWYLLYQCSTENPGDSHGPVFSTLADVGPAGDPHPAPPADRPQARERPRVD